MLRHRVRLVVLLLAIASVIAASGCGAAGLAFKATPTTLNFGGVVGTRLTVTFTNETAAEIRPNARGVIGTTGFVIENDTCANNNIPAGGTCTARIRLTENPGINGQFVIQIEPNTLGAVTLIH